MILNNGLVINLAQLVSAEASGEYVNLTFANGAVRHIDCGSYTKVSELLTRINNALEAKP